MRRERRLPGESTGQMYLSVIKMNIAYGRVSQTGPWGCVACHKGVRELY